MAHSNQQTKRGSQFILQSLIFCEGYYVAQFSSCKNVGIVFAIMFTNSCFEPVCLKWCSGLNTYPGNPILWSASIFDYSISRCTKIFARRCPEPHHQHPINRSMQTHLLPPPAPQLLTIGECKINKNRMQHNFSLQNKALQSPICTGLQNHCLREGGTCNWFILD